MDQLKKFQRCAVPAGTTNFVHRFPFVCVSIGLSVGTHPVLGVVYNPIMGELFTAVKGRGALLNGDPTLCYQSAEILASLRQEACCGRVQYPA